ncbi:MAG: SMC-Scp complex subunit ScpB [Deltaproteobacteria bacterium]|nr:SMC-Scp complex subunit ScpB [Deltaproteobacteria bacterium]
MENKEELKAIIEALIFASEKPLGIDRIKEIVEDADRADVVRCISLLQEESREGRGFYLSEVAEGYQFRTRPRFSAYLQKLYKIKAPKFSQPALETLAIIAYRQPITRAEVEELRGVDAGGVIKSLLDKKLIKIVGKKDVPGRPMIYGTTREFLEAFGLKDLKSLPTLKDLAELGERKEPAQAELVFEGNVEGTLEGKTYA